MQSGPQKEQWKNSEVVRVLFKDDDEEYDDEEELLCVLLLLEEEKRKKVKRATTLRKKIHVLGIQHFGAPDEEWVEAPPALYIMKKNVKFKCWGPFQFPPSEWNEAANVCSFALSFSSSSISALL